MKISMTSPAKITAAIATAEGRATARCVTAEDIIDAAADAESNLKDAGVLRTMRQGAVARLGPANSYEYAAEGTYATLTRGGKSWFLTDIRRRYVGATAYGSGERLTVRIAGSINLMQSMGRDHGVDIATPKPLVEARDMLAELIRLATDDHVVRDLAADIQNALGAV